MATRKAKHPVTGDIVDAPLVKIMEVENHPIILKLGDGTVARIKLDIYEAMRIPDAWDGDSNPIYHFRWNAGISVLESPDRLRKDADTAP